ncbi:MAG: hypothetical protein JKY93_12640, partial [Gammaproteobacteria bacterium]|nr:hypothetical protein [Gammaproteobacteria bacterium]
ENLRKQAHLYGAVLSREVLESAAKYKDEMTNTTSIIKGMGAVIGGVLMPEMTKLIEGFANWYLANKKVINDDLTSFAKRLAAGIKDFGDWLKVVIPKVSAFVDKIGGMKTVAIGLAAVISGPLVLAFGSLALGLVMLGTTIKTTIIPAIAKMNLAFLANPIVLIVAAIAGAAYLLIKYWEPVKTFFSGLWNGIADSAKAMWATVEPIINAAKSLFGGDTDALVEVASNNAPRTQGQRGGRRGRLLNQNSQTNVSGQLDIKITSEGHARVQKVKSETPGFNLNVDSGLSLAGL